MLSRIRKYRPYQVIPQEHSMGCAVACVASRCGVSYKKARLSFSEPTHAWTIGYFCKEIVAALAQYELSYEFDAYRPRSHSKFLHVAGTIVYIAVCEQYSVGHYLLRTTRGWMNPWVNAPQIYPLQYGVQRQLPGVAEYIIYERGQGSSAVDP